MAAKDKVAGDAHAGDDKEAPKEKVKKESGPMKLVIVGAVALFLAVLGAQVAAPILTKMIAGDPSAPRRKLPAPSPETSSSSRSPTRRRRPTRKPTRSRSSPRSTCRSIRRSS